MTRFRPRKGTVRSLKLGIDIPYGSSIERDFILWLEYWKHVTWYRPYPFTIRWLLDDVVHDYTPDFEVHDNQGKSIVECEHIDLINTADAIQQQRIGKAWSLANQYSFVLATSQEIQQGFGYKGLRILWKYRKTRVSPYTEAQILNILQKRGSISLDELLSSLSPKDKWDSFAPVCALLFSHKIETDIHQKFGLDWVIHS